MHRLGIALKNLIRSAYGSASFSRSFLSNPGPIKVTLTFYESGLQCMEANLVDSAILPKQFHL